jgi:hypothetical protein
MATPHRPSGRVTPKGVRPAGVTPRAHGDKPSGFARPDTRQPKAPQTKRSGGGPAPGAARRGHRGG